MTDKRKRGELIASTEVAQLGPAKLAELRESADALVEQLRPADPDLKQAQQTILAMIKILRPLTGTEIGGFRSETVQ